MASTYPTQAASPAEPTSRDLLLRMRSLQVLANRAEMARARAAAELFQHLSADYGARRASAPDSTLTPLAEIVAEAQPVTGQSAGRIRADVEQVLLLDRHLPWLAEHLDRGRFDLFRVRPVTDAVREDLADHPEALTRFIALMRRWVDRAVRDSTDLVNRTHAQVRNHVHYLVTKVLAHEMDDRFRRRHRQRSVSTYPTGDGMAALVVDADVVSVTRAVHHLDLLARAARVSGDSRTLDQLRSDFAIDLLSGTSVDRPAQSTGHRLLTDPARGALELSTTSYRPTAPIWREVVASQPSCFAPTCERPATDCDLDHRLRWPEAPTSTRNLGPACRSHHRAKHTPGAGLRRANDGTLRFTTRAGLTHLVSPSEQPTCDDAGVSRAWVGLIEIQPNHAELAEAVDSLRQHRHWIERSLVEAERIAAPDHGWWDVPSAEPEMSSLTH